MQSLLSVIRSRLFFVVLLLLHALLLLLLYRHFGLNVNGEGDKYYSSAAQLANGNAHQAFAYQWLYSIYILYLALFIKLGLTQTAIIVLTYLLSMLAYACFYKLLRHRLHISIARIWLAFMLLSPMLQFWTLSLYSEPFFIALMLLCARALLCNEAEPRLPWLAIVLSVLLIFTRPSGILVLLALWSFWLWQRYPAKLQVIVYSALGLLLVLGICFACLVPLHYRGYVPDLSQGSVYAGFPLYGPPLPPGDHYTLLDCYAHLRQQAGTGQSVLLFFKKTVSFFVLQRPYYSDWHNRINGAHLLFYVLCVYALLRIRIDAFRAWLWLCVGIVALHALLTGVFFNEWSERYTVVAFPFIFVAAAIGFYNLKQAITRRAV